MSATAFPQVRIAKAAHELGRADTPARQWEVISELLQDLFGHRLFTALVYLKAQRLMGRIYTSDGNISPLGGFKATGKGPWSSRVLDEGLVYVGSHENDIRSVFSESEMLIQHGLHSVLNIPIWFGGEVIGSLNLLNHRAAYDHVSPPLLALIAAMCTPVFLAEKSNALEAVAGLDISKLDSV
ncbi:GAF domain-containing protein [Variovorax sp. HJSM1_2]|uniref:GAF domain-containing protein n=1 Tax=Variovorax sp. HJSM1_2 TaxID=3366263 RepID=UPI003BC1DE33